MARAKLTEGQPHFEVPSESERFPDLAKALRFLPGLLPSVSKRFLDASLIDSDTEKKVVQHGGFSGAQLLLDALELKLEQFGDYENLVLAVLTTENDLKGILDTSRQPAEKLQPSMKKPSQPHQTQFLRLSPELMPRQISRSDYISFRVLLHELFNSLLVNFTEFASESDIYLDRVKIMLNILLRYSHHSLPDSELQTVLTGFEQCPSIDRAVKYLMEQNLLNCLNLQVLKLFQIKGFDKRIQEYEVSHQLFMSNEFETIAKAVQEMAGSADQPENGLPEMTINLAHPWETKSYNQWQDVLQGIVDWTEFMLIKNIRCSSNAVSITYAILPFMLMRIVKDIDDTNTFKRLNGVRVSCTIPPDVMNIGRTEAKVIKREIELRLGGALPDSTSSTTSMNHQTAMQTDIASVPTGYKLLTPLDDDCRCQLCYGLLNQPRQLLCCGNMICYSHANNIEDRCPYCRKPYQLLKYIRTEKKVKKLPVQCTAKDCYWRGPLEDLENHTCPEPKDIHLKKKEMEEVEAYVLETSRKIMKVQEGQKACRIKLSLKEPSPFKGVESIADGKMLYVISDTDSKDIDWPNATLVNPTQTPQFQAQLHSSVNSDICKPLQCAIRILSFRDGPDYEVYIIVTKNIENHMEQAINRFEILVTSDYKIPVTDTLVLTTDKIVVKSNKESSDHVWMIEPKSSVQIHRADIEDFNESQDIPPWLSYYVMMKEPESCSSRLILHDFIFEGTRGDMSFKVKIDRFSQKQAERLKSEPHYNSGATNVCVSTETCYEGVSKQGGEVNIAHLGLLNHKLWDLQSYWEPFARALPVPDYVIRGIKTSYLQTSPLDKFQQMMEKWRIKGGDRTWQIIHTALTKVRRNDMADDVFKTYPHLDTNVPFDQDGYTSIMTDVLGDVIPIWDSFGLQLGLPYSEIQEIKGERFQPISALNDLLRQWIGLKGSDANIIDIIRACEKIGHGELAQQLKADSDMCHAFPVLMNLLSNKRLHRFYSL